MLKSEAIKLIIAVNGVWPDAKIQPEIVSEIWASFFADVPFEVGRAAVIEMGREGRTKAPAPGDILTHITERVLNIPDGDRAWVEVKEQVRKVGYTPPGHRLFSGGRFIDPPQPAFSNPAIEEAVRVVTWKGICLCEISDEPILRAQFLKAYEAIRGRAIKAGLATLVPTPALSRAETGRALSEGSDDHGSEYRDTAGRTRRLG